MNGTSDLVRHWFKAQYLMNRTTYILLDSLIELVCCIPLTIPQHFAKHAAVAVILPPTLVKSTRHTHEPLKQITISLVILRSQN